MKTIKYIKEHTKEEYKQGILDACNDIKNRADDILCDFDKHLKKITITIELGVDKISIIKIEKIANVEGEE